MMLVLYLGLVFRICWSFLMTPLSINFWLSLKSSSNCFAIVFVCFHRIPSVLMDLLLLENFVGFLWWPCSFECGDDEFLTVEEAVGFLWLEICLVVGYLDWIFIRKIFDLFKRVKFDSLIVLRRGEECGTKSFWWIVRKLIYRRLFSCFIDLINSCSFGNSEFSC